MHGSALGVGGWACCNMKTLHSGSCYVTSIPVAIILFYCLDNHRINCGMALLIYTMNSMQSELLLLLLLLPDG